MRLKKAFSLTELIIVLVILAVVFAATMPIVTKRKLATSDFDSQSIWQYVKNDNNLDSYYDVGSKGYPAVAYIGLSPSYKSEDSGANVSPYSGKLTIKALRHATPYTDSSTSVEGIQRQIQFRYGVGNGAMTGTLFADSYNLLLGAGYTKLLKPGKTYGANSYNTIMGLHTADNISSISNSTIVGNNSMVQSDNDSHNYLTIVGNYSGNGTQLSGPNVFVGHKTGGIPSVQTSVGRGSTNKIHPNINVNNVAIGYGALSDVPDDVQVYNNVFVGYNSGGYSYPAATSKTNHKNSDDYIYNNVVVGTPYRMSQARNNTIIGYNTYDGRNPIMQNLTAIGYNACSSVDASGDNISRTCIGTNAGHFVSNPDYWKGPGVYNESGKSWDIINSYGDGDKLKTDDSVLDERIFIGSPPKSYSVGEGYSLSFPGRSVIEIHNIPRTIDKHNKVAPGATVVFNSNLVVRGRYFGSYLGKYGGIGVEKDDDKTSVNYIYRNRWDEISRTKLICSRDSYMRKYLIGGSKRYFCTGWSAQDSTSKSYMRMGDLGGFRCVNGSATNPYNCFVNTTKFPRLYQSSDERLKDNIQDSNIGLGDVLKLKPYNYVFKADTTKTPQVGVLAQDLIKVFPKSVFKGDDGYFRIRWDEMFYSVVNAIKELNSKIEKIASDISNLEKSVIQIGNNQKVLKKRIAELNSKAARLEHK